MEKSEIKAFMKAFKKHNKELAEEHNIHISTGNVTYTDGEFYTKVTFTEAVPGHDLGQAKHVQSLIKYGPRYGLSDADYDREFDTGNGTMLLKGIKPKARKYPIIAQQKSTGKLYKMPPTVVPFCTT